MYEEVAVKVERAVSGYCRPRVLDRLALTRGLPQVIYTDNARSSAVRRR